jgi:hypothetical protein
MSLEQTEPLALGYKVSETLREWGIKHCSSVIVEEERI